MKSRGRTLQFDSLERLTLLSTMTPSVGHAFSLHAHRPPAHLPAFVRAVERVADRFGSNVTVTPVLAVPGGFTEYEISFQVKGQTYTTEITVPAPNPPGPGPQPG